jgi:hypothetical protein
LATLARARPGSRVRRNIWAVFNLFTEVYGGSFTACYINIKARSTDLTRVYNFWSKIEGAEIRSASFLIYLKSRGWMLLLPIEGR